MSITHIAMWIGIIAGLLTIAHFMGFVNPVGEAVASLVLP